MAGTKTSWLLLSLGVGIPLAGVGIAVWYSGALKRGIEKARNDVFDVGPGCEWIRFKGMPEFDADQAQALMATADKYVFEPAIKDALEQEPIKALSGADQVHTVELYVLNALFPECEGKWGKKTSPNWLVETAIRFHVQQLMGFSP